MTGSACLLGDGATERGFLIYDFGFRMADLLQIQHFRISWLVRLGKKKQPG